MSVLYSLSCLPVLLDSVSAVRVSCILCLVCQFLWIQSLSCECLVFSVYFASTFGFSLCRTSVLYSLSSLRAHLDSVSTIRIRMSCILFLLRQFIWFQSLPYVYACPVFSVYFASTSGFSVCHTSCRVFLFACTFGFSLCLVCQYFWIQSLPYESCILCLLCQYVWI